MCKWIKTSIFELNLKKTNPFDIHEPCINLAKNDLIFEQYRMNLNREKYCIEVRNDDAIKRNKIFFDFMQLSFNQLDGFYLREICLLIYAIMEDQTRKQSSAEIEKLNRLIKARKKIKEGKYKPSPKNPVY